MRPSQNTGIDTPMFAKAMVAASTVVLCLRAAMIPSGTPTTTAMNRAETASSIVRGSRSMRSWVTGRENRIDSPRLSVITFFM